MKTYITKDARIFKKLMRKYGKGNKVILRIEQPYLRGEYITERRLFYQMELAYAQGLFINDNKYLPAGAQEWIDTVINEADTRRDYLLPDGEYGDIRGFETDGYSFAFIIYKPNGERVELQAPTYLVPVTELDGFKLTDNIAVRKGIYKGIQRCDGNCPCKHPENDGDLHCPCEGYRTKNRCCCKLYVEKSQDS